MAGSNAGLQSMDHASVQLPGDMALRRRVARLLTELNGEGILNEHQCARCFGCDLPAWRRIAHAFSFGASFVETDDPEPMPDESPVDSAIAAAIGRVEPPPATEAAWEAFDVLAGLHPSVVIDRDDPMQGALAIFDHVQAEVSHWQGRAERVSAMLLDVAPARAAAARAAASGSDATGPASGAAPTDAAIALALTRYEKLRRLNPRQFAGLLARSEAGTSFDALVDMMPAAGVVRRAGRA